MNDWVRLIQKGRHDDHLTVSSQQTMSEAATAASQGTRQLLPCLPRSKKTRATGTKLSYGYYWVPARQQWAVKFTHDVAGPRLGQARHTALDDAWAPCDARLLRSS